VLVVNFEKNPLYKSLVLLAWVELFFVPYRRIFVYNICLSTISDTVSDGATKRLILNIERAQHD